MLARLLLMTLLEVPGGAIPAPPRAAEGWLTDWESARKAAQASSRSVLVDFQAVWCYSCYYMEQKVLSRDLFKRVAGDMVLLKLDVDSPEGRELKGRFRVRALPSYLVLDSSGTELGRIAGERTEVEFVMDLRRI
ncbi:MAG: thioredoxin family protein, partial [Elusimicrobiota bacterium]